LAVGGWQILVNSHQSSVISHQFRQQSSVNSQQSTNDY